mmetsp:Transcript_28767/g.66411  ORF Transcript_28767/g.66411 Transcript_28767/m.66411 type:complete len:255 (-) Transcript_28767:1473-2237(-)
MALECKLRYLINDKLTVLPIEITTSRVIAVSGVRGWSTGGRLSTASHTASYSCLSCGPRLVANRNFTSARARGPMSDASVSFCGCSTPRSTRSVMNPSGGSGDKAFFMTYSSSTRYSGSTIQLSNTNHVRCLLSPGLTRYTESNLWYADAVTRGPELVPSPSPAEWSAVQRARNTLVMSSCPGGRSTMPGAGMPSARSLLMERRCSFTRARSAMESELESGTAPCMSRPSYSFADRNPSSATRRVSPGREGSSP